VPEKPGECPAWVELSDGEVERLASMPLAALEVRRSNRCELEDGHTGRHACLGQGSIESETATTWWIWWTDAGDHDIGPADTCPALRDGEHPDANGCFLPLRHPGHHSFWYSPERPWT
jgi:hypothetical protein